MKEFLIIILLLRNRVRYGVTLMLVRSVVYLNCLRDLWFWYVGLFIGRFDINHHLAFGCGFC